MAEQEHDQDRDEMELVLEDIQEMVRDGLLIITDDERVLVTDKGNRLYRRSLGWLWS